MAIIKHSSSKNARYGDVPDYYTYKHTENHETGHYEPVINEYGFQELRDNFAITYITAHGQEDAPEKWANACIKTNRAFRKNEDYNDRKTHEYIISHPEEDRPLMTMEDLLEEGKAFVRENLQGYDALIAVHRDTDNDHIHISINSVRAVQREEQDWMLRNDLGEVLPCEVKAGGKHQDSPAFRLRYNDWLLHYTRQHGLAEKDNNAIAQEHKRQRRQQELEAEQAQEAREKAGQEAAPGPGSTPPPQGKKLTVKERYLREALLDSAAKAKSLEELAARLKEDYNVTLIRRGRTLSLLHPESTKAVRLRSLELSQEQIQALTATGSLSPEAAQLLTEEPAQRTEQHNYARWLRQQRLKNAGRAEEIIGRSEALISQKLRADGQRYDREDFQELNVLVRTLTFVQRDLQTEADKLDMILERWGKYLDDTTPIQERQQHGSYIRWCGLDPENLEELQCRTVEREAISAQQDYVGQMREALIDTAAQWRGHNDVEWANENLTWTVNREAQLKQQLKSIQASRRKLSQIAYNCQKAADRRIYNKDYLAKAEHFRKLWNEKLQAEKAVKEKLHKVRQQHRQAKKDFAQASRSSGQNR